MRWFAGLLLLLLLFGAAALWQSKLLAGYRDDRARDRAQLTGTGDGASGELEQGWSRLVVGAPSGARPIEIPEIADSAAQEAGGDQPVREADWIEERSRALEDFVIEVQEGQTLSQIAQAHYQRHSPEVVEALARYNGIHNSNQIRAGQRIHLPDIERLLPDEQR
jgi:hypothetical protein